MLLMGCCVRDVWCCYCELSCCMNVSAPVECLLSLFYLCESSVCCVCGYIWLRFGWAIWAFCKEQSHPGGGDWRPARPKTEYDPHFWGMEKFTQFVQMSAAVQTCACFVALDFLWVLILLFVIIVYNVLIHELLMLLLGYFIDTIY